MSTFRAPWSTTVKLFTVAISAALLAVVAGTNAVVAAVVAAIVMTTALFAVRGYSVDEQHVTVHRLIGAKRFSLDAVRSAEHRPGITGGSWRLFGVGGLFGSVGVFHNKALGRYHAFTTDAARSVVLDLGDRTVVVTPDDPVRFVEAVEEGRG